MADSQGEPPAEPRAQFRPGEVLGNRYRIDGLLGRGGMGAAYAATNLVTGKHVAVKWLVRERSASALHRTLREARAACRVRHPNVVDVYDVAEHEGSLFLVMELLRGGSLQSLIRARGRLPLDELLGFLLPVLRGLHELHRSGVIHRDVKPANIFVCESAPGETPVAKLLDFGVSKIVTSSADLDTEPSITDNAALIGTPSYMAPEQLQEAKSVDARADVYACGAVLYHALSGRKPFESNHYAALVTKVLNGSPQPLSALRSDLPKDVCALVHHALERDPARRLPSIEALIQGLEPHDPRSASIVASTLATETAARRSDTLRSTLRWAVTAALGALLVLGWGLAHWQSDRSARVPGGRSPHLASVRAVQPVVQAEQPLPWTEPQAMRAPSNEGATVHEDAPRKPRAIRTEGGVPRPGRPARPAARKAAIAPPRITPTGDAVIELTDKDF